MGQLLHPRVTLWKSKRSGRLDQVHGWTLTPGARTAYAQAPRDGVSTASGRHLPTTGSPARSPA